MWAWKTAPALACGCTIVIKPSELTPLTALVRRPDFEAHHFMTIGSLRNFANLLSRLGMSLIQCHLAYTDATGPASRLVSLTVSPRWVQ
jgi:hypothetical protein